MRIRTLVLIALVAVLAIASLPTSHSQTSANAPQEDITILTKDYQINRYLIERTRANASRSRMQDHIGKEIVDTGKNYFGVPYCWGGESSRCFDCSGFIKYVYNKNGIEMPRTANEQLKVMTIIPESEAQQGDLVFFVYRNGYAHHVGIYVGNNMILHSPKPGRRVKLEEIWSTRVVFARDPSMMIAIPPSVEAIVEEAKTEDGVTY
jgi:cell wall-associated NlpC family hydrolase